jgi:hypothetical protein
MITKGGFIDPYWYPNTHRFIQLATDKLVVVLLLDSAGSKDVPGGTVLVLAVLKRQLAKRGNHVLDRRVLAAAVLAAESVEPCDAVEHVIDNGDNDGNTDRVGPDDNDSDNVSPSILTELAVVGRGVGLVVFTGHPAKDAEDGSKSIDTQNSDNELEGGEGLAATSDEDQPVLSKGNLKEEDRLDSTEVLDDTTAGDEERTTDDPSTESKQETEDDGDEPDLGQLPFDGTLFGVGVVIGDSDGGQIGEQGEEYDELGTDGLVEDDHGSDEVDLQVQAERDTVLDVGLHTLENLAGGLDGQDDRGETRGKEDDISGSLGSLSGTLDGDTTVGLLERWSIVDTVTSHGSQVTTLLQHLDDLVLVFGEDFGETVGALDKIVLGGAGETAVDELGGVVNLGTESKHFAGLLGNGDSVTTVDLLVLEIERAGREETYVNILTGTPSC